MTPFITFEGIEGSGKTTLKQRLGAYLKTLDFQVQITRKPSGYAINDRFFENWMVAA